MAGVWLGANRWNWAGTVSNLAVEVEGFQWHDSQKVRFFAFLAVCLFPAQS